MPLEESQFFSSQVSNIDLRLIRIFKAVVESGGFAAAEVSLNISRSAISIAMTDLEKRIGLSLCQRGRAGFVLTDEGKGVYDCVLQLLTSLETFHTQVSSIHAHLIGDLNIGIADNLVTIEHMNISTALSSLKKKSSDVRINLRMATPTDIETGVLDGSLHVGVVPNVRSLPAIEYHPLYDETTHLYCSNHHPLAAQQKITEEDILASDLAASNYIQSSEVRRLEKQFHITAEASDREGVAFLIITGDYIGFLPTHYAQHWLESGQLQVLMPKRFFYTTELAAITRQGARPNRILETFMEHLNTR